MSLLPFQQPRHVLPVRPIEKHRCGTSAIHRRFPHAGDRVIDLGLHDPVLDRIVEVDAVNGVDGGDRRPVDLHAVADDRPGESLGDMVQRVDLSLRQRQRGRGGPGQHDRSQRKLRVSVQSPLHDEDFAHIRTLAGRVPEFGRRGRRVTELGTFEGVNLARARASLAAAARQRGSRLQDIAGFAAAMLIVGIMLVFPW